ncbi:hypothetical protein BGZ59_009484 [Podila verticillata]|nr:hypothetical protein BGZ59_009484 [Podila verticillata]
MPSSVSASTLASDSTVKRWSGGDSKGKDKSKDASEPVTSPASPPENRVIMAATVEKLIERLTSDIDYTFLTDFFLVYRLFITPFSLLKLLMARFQWALANDSSQKHIVRIRTFVTLRHWILSFYKYDFVASRGVLHKALNKYLKSLHQHPVVATSTLDQRIVRDLRRHLHAQKKMSRTSPSPREFLGCHCDQVHSGYSAVNNQSSSGEGDSEHICSPSQGDEHRINSDAASADESEGEDLSDDEEGSIRTTRISSEGDVPQSQRTNTNSKKSKAGTPNTSHPTTQPASKHGLPSPAGSTSWFSKGKGRRSSATQRSNSTNDYFGPAAFSHTTHEDQKNQSADSSQTSGDYSTSSHQSRRSRTQPSHSQLMSPLDPGRRLPLPTPDSLRSVEPYMNPPPRSITGSEKGSVWSHCLSSTMEQFSKVKRAIMSGSSQRNSRFLDSGSSIVLAGAAATETYRRKASKSAKSPRLWPMHRSRTGDIEDLRSAALSDDDPVVYASPAPSLSSFSAHLPDTPQEDHPVATASQEVLAEKTAHRFVKKSDHGSDSSTASTNLPLVKRRLGRSQTTEEKESRSSWLSFSSTPASMFASIFTPGHSESKSAKNIRSRIAQGRSGSLDSASTTPAVQPSFLQTQPSLSFLNKPKRTKPSPLSHSTTSRKSMEDVITVHVLKPQRSLRSLRKKNTREVLTERRWTVSKDDSVSDLCDSQTEKLYHIHQEPSDSVLPSAKVQSPLEEDAALSREIVASPQEPVPHHVSETLSHVVEQEKSFQELPTQPESRRTSIHTSVCSTPMVAAKKATRRVISHVHSHSHPLVITPLEPTKDHTPSSAASQPSTPVRPLLSKQMRSSSDPHLLTMAAFAATTSPTDRDILALAVNNARRHLSPSRPHPILTIRQFRTESRQHSRQHSPVHSRFFQDQDLEVDAYGVPVPRPILPPPFVSMVLMYRSEMIAQQLCLIERELLLRVQWYELVDAGWTKKKQQQEQKEQQERQEEVQVKHERQEQDNESEKAPPVEEVEQVIDIMSDEKPEDANHRASLESCPGDVEDVKVSLRRKRYSSESRGRRSSRVHTPIPKEVDENSPNIKQLVDRFNMTCEWVTAEILRSTDDDLRVKVVEKFIRIAHTCYNHSNFSSLTQIMLGLQHHTVSRLSRTWERVQPEESKVMQELTDFTAPFHNFKHIRNAMKAVADEWGGPGGAIMGDSQPLATGQYPTLSTGAPTPPLETVNTGRRFDHGMSGSGSGSGSGTGFFSKRPTSSHGQYESVTGWPYPQASSTTHAGPTTTTASSSGFLLDDRNHIQQQQQGGSIPFLGIYLSDLVYNTELPSYVEPRALPKNQETAQVLSEAMASTMLQHLPTPSSSLGSLKVLKNETEQLPSFASTLSTEEPMTATEPLTGANALANKIMLVNMHKHRTTATIIKRILTFQTLAGRYPFQHEPDVFDWLKAMERAEDPDDFDRMSALCEERIRP